MNERWAAPVIPVAIEQVTDRVEHVGGRWMYPVNWTIKPEDFERIKQGYVCMDCYVPQQEPFPLNCRFCGSRMHPPGYYHERLEKEFEGYKHVGPSTTLREEQDRLDDYAERKFWQPGNSVYIPNGVRI